MHFFGDKMQNAFFIIYAKTINKTQNYKITSQKNQPRIKSFIVIL